MLRATRDKTVALSKPFPRGCRMWAQLADGGGHGARDLPSVANEPFLESAGAKLEIELRTPLRGAG